MNTFVPVNDFVAISLSPSKIETLAERERQRETLCVSVCGFWASNLTDRDRKSVV